MISYFCIFALSKKNILLKKSHKRLNDFPIISYVEYLESTSAKKRTPFGAYCFLNYKDLDFDGLLYGKRPLGKIGKENFCLGQLK